MSLSLVRSTLTQVESILSFMSWKPTQFWDEWKSRLWSGYDENWDYPVLHAKIDNLCYSVKIDNLCWCVRCPRGAWPSLQPGELTRSCPTLLSTPPVRFQPWKEFSINVLIGLEKYELLAKLAGNEDPFFLRAVTRGKVWVTSSIQIWWQTSRAPRRTPPSSMRWTTTGSGWQ